MSLSTGEELLPALRAFAELPSWLTRAMDPGRVRVSLLRHVPELADGRQHLVDCLPTRMRAKGGQWLARYELVVADPSEGTRPVVLTGELVPPTGPPVAPPPPGSRFAA